MKNRVREQVSELLYRNKVSSIFLCFAVLFSSVSTAQNRFERFTDAGHVNNEGNSLRIFEENVIVSGWYNTFPFGSDYGYHSVVYDSIGTVLYLNSFFIDSVELNPWAHHDGTATNGDFYSGHFGQNVTNTLGSAFVIRHAWNGDSLLTRAIDSANSAVYGIDLFDDNMIFAVGGSRDPGQFEIDPVVYLLDTNLVVMKSKIINEPLFKASPFSVKAKTQNEIYVGSNNEDGQGDQFGVGYLLDSNFNVTWRRVYGPGRVLTVMDLDSTGLIWKGILDTTLFGSTNSSGHWYLMRTDFSGAIQWRTFFDRSEVMDIWNVFYDKPNNRIISCGVTTNRRGWLCSVDLAGNIQWERTFIGEPTTTSVLEDVLVDSDNFIWCAGEVRQFDTLLGVNQSNVWLLKLDSMGCLIENCVTSIPNAPVYPDGLRVYPNPNDGSFTIELPASFSSDGLNIQVYEITGKLVYNEFTQSRKAEVRLDVGASGLYLVRCISQEGILQKKVLVQQ